MSGRFIALVVIMVLFGVLTALALMDVGYFGILRPHFQSWGGAQVFTDLVIVGVLSCIWMSVDSRQSGVNPWPFIAKSVSLNGIYVASREVFERMNRAFVQQRIFPVIDRVFPFDQAREAFAHMESKRHIGKIVIKVA